jgi:hypothetical protein
VFQDIAGEGFLIDGVETAVLISQEMVFTLVDADNKKYILHILISST